MNRSRPRRITKNASHGSDAAAKLSYAQAVNVAKLSKM